MCKTLKRCGMIWLKLLLGVLCMSIGNRVVSEELEKLKSEVEGLIPCKYTFNIHITNNIPMLENQ
jgi:hypothetical protein